ncbi:MAG TPA: Hsp20/alpha crystallin family protein [Albitalea sp.]|nr:Hsp20/alpha crystallin family protein [Albitalea sp.]
MDNTKDLVKQDNQNTPTAPPLIPPVDVTEDDSGITLLADLPGATRETLSIDVNGDTLTLEASLGLEQPQGLQPVYAEIRSARYRRSFTLSRELDSAHIDATLKDGVLSLRVPKLEQAKPRRIQVRAS